MGGPGSGRRRARPAVADCRALAIGELVDGGRWQRRSEGVIVWRLPQFLGATGRMSYRLSCQQESAEQLRLLLDYRYWPTAGGSSYRDQVELEGSAGRRIVARCPDCWRAVRSLYAPPGADVFLCRSCQELGYSRSRQRRSAAGLPAATVSLLAELAALPEALPRTAPRHYRAAPPAKLAARLAEQLPLSEQGLRLWSVRLRSCGLSYRQIARLIGTSKSSVARYCAAGPAGIDALALIAEWQLSAADWPEAQPNDDPRAIGRELRSLQRQLRRAGLLPRPQFEPEERRLLSLEADLEP